MPNRRLERALGQVHAHAARSAPRSPACRMVMAYGQHYKFLMLPTERSKARRTIFQAQEGPPRGTGRIWRRRMKVNFRGSRRTLSARRMALLATTVTSLAAAGLVFSPNSYSPRAFADAAQAQNLTEKVQQLPQRPVGFADIVEKVKPAVISVRVKIDHSSDSSSQRRRSTVPARLAVRTFLQTLRHAEHP